MDEVDNIIIDSLKNLPSNLDENIHSLKEFTTEDVLTAIVDCLERISPGTHFSRKMPPSMHLRLKLASNIAAHIKELGYKGDMGYQTILYCNEVEVRRVLMFLVERLPRDTNKIITSEELGYVPKLVKQIEEKMRLSLQKLWVPGEFLQHGVRKSADLSIRHSCGDCYALHSENIQLPKTQQECSEALKHYWNHNLPVVTKQCSLKNLIPSLLFKDNDIAIDKSYLKEFEEDTASSEITDIDVGTYTKKLPSETRDVFPQQNSNQIKIQKLVDEVQNYKRQCESLCEKHKIQKDNLAEVINQKTKEASVLSTSLGKINVKSKTYTVLSKEENFTKLKKLVENGNERLVLLNNQWNEVQTPLLEQYFFLQNNLNAEEMKITSDQEKLCITKDKLHQQIIELREKEKLENQLLEDYEKLNRNTNNFRSSYTRRILEIIANIKKQNNEIHKILKDTKDIQKDINNLNGQLDRSFTLSDELIFRDAKQDETARKAYKLLATLHTDCSDVVETVTECGVIERDSRNLQEQVDAELAREMAAKLERVLADLSQVKSETGQLLTHIKQLKM